MALTAGATSASHYGDWGGYDRDQLRPVSYINGDAGKNATVDSCSSCFAPDQYDTQKFSSVASGNPGDNNVHNDACFLDDRGNNVGKNIGATFRSTGTGYISACPDPDGAGPAVAVLGNPYGDGRMDSCFQSSYQEKGIAGGFEYHARVNITGTNGEQQVTWGMDRDGDGCIDSRNDDQVKVYWSATGLAGGDTRRVRVVDHSRAALEG